MAEYDPQACPPCRGSGTVVSNAGGERQELQCPWCKGSGRRPVAPESAD